jgi:hypothetical protein
LSALRVDFSRDGTQLVTCVHGAVRLHDERGAIARELVATRALDACWLDDDRVLALDDRGVLAWHRDGVLVDQHNLVLARVAAARIARDGDRFTALDATSLFGMSTRGKRMWSWHLGVSNEPRAFAASGNGGAAAIADRTSCLVVDAHRRVRFESRRDRATASTPAIALDRDGSRFARTGNAIGVIRLGRGSGDVPDPRDTAMCVALDDRGVIAAYAYPEPLPPGARGALRFDYLDPSRDGPAGVGVVDAAWLDPDVRAIAALAFDRASRRIACLGAGGAIDVLPVP